MSDGCEMKVALASLVKMINLLGAELLVGKYRENIDVFESLRARQAVRQCRGRRPPQETAAGVALAHSLVDPVLKHLRERVRSPSRHRGRRLRRSTRHGHRLN